MPRIRQGRFDSLCSSLALLVCCLLPAIAWSQDDDALDRLIFDPVLQADIKPPRVNGGLVTGRPAPPVGLFIPTLSPPAPEPSRAMAGDFAAYAESIAMLEQDEGPFAPALVQDLLALAILHQGEGSHAIAIDLLNRADHISRVNNGLHHPEQFPVIEALIASYQAMEDYAAVNDMQRYLLYLNRKLQEDGSIARVPSLAGLGDRNMATFDRSLLVDGSEPGLPYRFGAQDMAAPVLPEMARYYALGSLYRAQSNYSAAISALLDNENFLHPRLLELEYKHLETLFLLGFANEFIDNPHYYLTSARRTANTPNRWTYLRRNKTGYEEGVKTFERILLYLDSDASVPGIEKVIARIEYADWQILFNYTQAATDLYEAAYALGLELGLGEEIDGLFNPAYPVQLPLFSAKPNSREKYNVGMAEELSWDGYIDMAFDINRTGTVRDMRVLEKSPGTSFEMEERLRRYLKNSPFRPVVIDGETAGRDDLRMRYYYTFYSLR